ncbi:MAG: hypothetical protein HFJ51_01700 [Clostridia bacterium]|nr:hypothetical protein [Clostridia bacterium]
MEDGFVHYADLLLGKIITKLTEENITFNKEIPKLVTARMRKRRRTNWSDLFRINKRKFILFSQKKLLQ